MEGTLRDIVGMVTVFMCVVSFGLFLCVCSMQTHYLAMIAENASPGLWTSHYRQSSSLNALKTRVISAKSLSELQTIEIVVQENCISTHMPYVHPL